MLAVLQRVTHAEVRVDGNVVGSIQRGWVVLLGVAQGDTLNDAEWISAKVLGLRAFGDNDGKMNLSVAESGGSILVVSQFTLLADCQKGRRPSFTGAAPPQEAEPLYEAVCSLLERANLPIKRGVFRAHMAVELVNDGPVTLLLDSREKT